MQGSKQMIHALENCIYFKFIKELGQTGMSPNTTKSCLLENIEIFASFPMTP